MVDERGREVSYVESFDVGLDKDRNIMEGGF